MKSVERFNYTSEAIAFQDGKLFNEIVKIFKAVKDEGFKGEDQLRKHQIDQVIMKYTGLNVKTSLEEDSSDFCIYLPKALNNHVLQPHHLRKGEDKSDVLKYIHQARKSLTGQVDILNCKVSGDFSKMQALVSIDPYFIFGVGVSEYRSSDVYVDGKLHEIEYEAEIAKKYEGGWKYSPEKMAATYLHEIGHFFTMFEYMVETITTNQVLNAISKELLECNDYGKRLLILNSAEKTVGMTILDKEALSKDENYDSVYSVLFSSKINEMRSSTDTWVYDIKSWEFLADQFAIRHGAGRHLAEAIYDSEKTFSYIKRTKVQVIASAVAIFIFNILTIPTGIGILSSIFCLFWDFGLDKRDHEEAIPRLNRIKQDLVNGIKNPKLSKEVKESIVFDIECVDKMLSTMEDHRSVMAVFWDFVRPAKRDARKQYEFQMKMEKLAGNSLFVNAAKLSTLN